MLNFLETIRMPTFIGEPSGSRGKHLWRLTQTTLPNSASPCARRCITGRTWMPGIRGTGPARISAPLTSEAYRQIGIPPLKRRSV